MKPVVWRHRKIKIFGPGFRFRPALCVLVSGAALSGPAALADGRAYGDAQRQEGSITALIAAQSGRQTGTKTETEAGNGAAEALRLNHSRVRLELLTLKQENPEWGARLEEIVRTFDAGNRAEAEQALRALDGVMDARQLAANRARARALYAGATLLYPYDDQASVPLLEKAARLAETNFSYWLAYGDARAALGHYLPAKAAYKRGFDIAVSSANARDLSVALNRIGDVDTNLGDYAAARTAYAEVLAAARAVAAETTASAETTGTAQARRDLSVSLNKVADMDAVLGDYAAARAGYAEGLAITRALADERTTAQARRDLSVALSSVADMDAQLGDPAAARAGYAAALEISRALAHERATPQARRDLSFALTRLADADDLSGQGARARATYGEALAIDRRLAAELKTPQARRDLSVSLERAGDLDARLGDAAAARAAYDGALQIRRELADALNTPQARRDLSVSLMKIGDTDISLGRVTAAHAAYLEALQIRRALAARPEERPEDMPEEIPGGISQETRREAEQETQRDLLISLYHVTALELDLGRKTAAESYFEEATRLIPRLTPPDRGQMETAFTELKAEISALPDE